MKPILRRVWALFERRRLAPLRCLLGLPLALPAMGCRSRSSAAAFHPLSIEEILALHEEGLTDAEIVQRIDESETVYPLSSEDVVRLRQTGLSPAVVDHMLNTRVEAAAASARRQERLRWLHPDPWFWYGPGYPWWNPPYPLVTSGNEVRVIRRDPSAK